MNCLRCSRKFIPSKWHPKQKFCSSTCRDKYNFNRYYTERKKEMHERVKIWIKKHPGKRSAFVHKLGERAKLRCLEHYSLVHIPICSEQECWITDIDMLVLDHINNDRKRLKHKYKGTIFYRWLIKENFPPGLQVLCANHNHKKEIRRTEEERAARYA